MFFVLRTTLTFPCLLEKHFGLQMNTLSISMCNLYYLNSVSLLKKLLI